jgi:NTP pyrophosphatase (non-canonical NTP hydrolase)
MNFDTYCEERKRTDVTYGEFVPPEVRSRINRVIPEMHMLMGMMTEIGELIDAYKKYIYYGKELDRTNLIEECGDLMWYYGGYVTTVGMAQNAILDKNISKLYTRYPEKFDSESAIIRNLEEERKTLENE